MEEQLTQELQHIYSVLLAEQIPLDDTAQRVLYDNVWGLYETEEHML